MNPLSWLRQLEQGFRDAFVSHRRVLSFDEYLQLFCDEPERQGRTVAQYLRDCMDHAGQTETERPHGCSRRWNLFDRPWDDGRDRLVGQEAAQEAFYRLLTNVVREARVTRFILLHGPNGSAKSSFIACLTRALEHYATLDEGAVYRFNWVFPTSRLSRKRVGFQREGETEAIESYATLEDEDLAARLPGDLRDHPLLLLPKEARRALLDELRAKGKLPASFVLGDYLRDGDLSPRSRTLADTLLAAYQGDYQRVLQHVQVERFYFSRRYRVGCVTVEPQLHVDASTRQVTMDQGLSNLPPSLRTLTLYEPQGDLVDANRGLVEYNDLLKKPLDSFKYLLSTCEKGTVALPNAILHLDALFLASSNEAHLNAFKEYQDFVSFKARMDLVKMPYLRDYTVEQAIYEDQQRAGEVGEVVAPHAPYVTALWAVLTRLRRPSAEPYPESIRGVIESLTPLQKAELYSGAREPADLTPEQSRELWAHVPMLLDEGQETGSYEGSFGASPREMKQVMLNARQSARYPGLHPLAILEELRALVRDRTVYDFLRLETDHGYHDHEGFIGQVRGRYLDLVDAEVRSSMGLVSAKQYEELFARYILHVSYALKGETLYDEATGRNASPDQEMMERLEALWPAAKGRDRFRRDLVERVGAWRIDHPGVDIDYRRLFPKLLEALESDYYREQRSTIRKLGEQVVAGLAAAAGAPAASSGPLALVATDRARAERIIERLETEHGHPRATIRATLGALMRYRYA